MSDPRTSIDDFVPKYASLADQILARPDDDRPFLTAYDQRHGRRVWTTKTWKQKIRDTAARLSAAGIRDGDRVAVLSRSDADTLATTFACWLLGAAAAPLDAGVATTSLQRTLQDLRPAAVVAAGSAEEVLPTLAETSALPAAVSKLAPAPTDEGLRVADSRPDRELLILQSSGTSGRSKGVVLSDRNLLANTDAMLSAFQWGPDDTVLTVLPISHGNGLIIGSLLPWLAGASMVLCDRFRADSFWHICEAEGATTSSIVPTVMSALIDTDGHRPPHYRDVISGSGPLTPQLAADFARRFVPVRQLYGLSETTAVLTVTPRTETATASLDVAPGTTAGPAVAHADVAVLDDNGQPCPQRVLGELVARGAMIMQRYEGMPSETDDALRGGWFHTGDQGAWLPGPDGRPWFTVTGRLKEIIIRGGLSISPLEIDAVLNDHPAVREALSFGYPDDHYGEEIGAFVVAESPVTEAELRDHCTQYLGRARCPRRIVFGSAIPRTYTGKPRRAALAQRVMET
jgi:long-chain acyl-CoA synthetase